jgi:hypothetical protein
LEPEDSLAIHRLNQNRLLRRTPTGWTLGP